MAKEKTPLVQTKGTFKAVGIVNRLSNEGAYKENTFDRGKNEGKEYRTLRFGIKTSENNELFVELFGMEKDVYAFKPLTKEDIAKGKKKSESKKISFENRDNIPSGWKLIGVTVGTFENEDEESQKIQYETYVEYDAVDEIFQNFEDGDSISVRGDIRFNEYENQAGEKVKQIQYQIKYASKLKFDVDFESEKFKEISSFEQEIVFVDSMFDKETKKLTVIGRTINYDGTWFDYPFIIDTNKPEMKDIATAFLKKLKFGDHVTVVGLCVNKVEQQEIEIVEDSIFGLGGSTPTGFRKANGKRVTELQITGIAKDDKGKLKYELKRYSLDDFVKEEELIDEDILNDDDNPFASLEEEDEDNLPF